MKWEQNMRMEGFLGYDWEKSDCDIVKRECESSEKLSYCSSEQS